RSGPRRRCLAKNTIGRKLKSGGKKQKESDFIRATEASLRIWHGDWATIAVPPLLSGSKFWPLPFSQGPDRPGQCSNEPERIFQADRDAAPPTLRFLRPDRTVLGFPKRPSTFHRRNFAPPPRHRLSAFLSLGQDWRKHPPAYAMAPRPWGSAE